MNQQVLFINSTILKWTLNAVSVECIKPAQNCVQQRVLVSMIITSVYCRSRKIHKLSDRQILKHDVVRWVSKEQSMATPQEMRLGWTSLHLLIDELVEARWVTSSVLITIWCDRQQAACELAESPCEGPNRQHPSCLRDVQWLTSAQCTAGGSTVNGGVAQRCSPRRQAWICSPSAS